jgi:hypothetical protein
MPQGRPNREEGGAALLRALRRMLQYGEFSAVYWLMDSLIPACDGRVNNEFNNPA